MNESRDRFGLWLTRVLAVAGVLTWLLLAFYDETAREQELRTAVAQRAQVVEQANRAIAQMQRFILTTGDSTTVAKAKALKIVPQE